MKIKKTQSQVFPQENKTEKEIKKEEEPEDVAAQSAASMTSGTYRRLRVPAALQSTLKQNMINSGSKKNIDTKSKLGGMMRSSLAQFASKIKDRSIC